MSSDGSWWGEHSQTGSQESNCGGNRRTEQAEGGAGTGEELVEVSQGGGGAG